ncbi:unnamed protein product [Linum trigynum]|uniref:Uncharacterized protein n=1 Tax=Linum trigynum TaxID=586398 RepID=A0AAV2CAU9_9ROSI
MVVNWGNRTLGSSKGEVGESKEGGVSKGDTMRVEQMGCAKNVKVTRFGEIKVERKVGTRWDGDIDRESRTRSWWDASGEKEGVKVRRWDKGDTKSVLGCEDDAMGSLVQFWL